MGLLLARTEREAEALAEFRQAGCTETDAFSNLGYALTLNGNLPHARIAYDKALALQPNSETAKRGLTELNCVAAKLDQAGNSNDRLVQAVDRR